MAEPYDTIISRITTRLITTRDAPFYAVRMIDRAIDLDEEIKRVDDKPNIYITPLARAALPPDTISGQIIQVTENTVAFYIVHRVGNAENVGGVFEPYYTALQNAVMGMSLPPEDTPLTYLGGGANTIPIANEDSGIVSWQENYTYLSTVKSQ